MATPIIDTLSQPSDTGTTVRATYGGGDEGSGTVVLPKPQRENAIQEVRSIKSTWTLYFPCVYVQCICSNVAI